MFRRLREKRPSHSTVVAYLALFLVLGAGSAVAIGGKTTQSVDGKAIQTSGGRSYVSKSKPAGDGQAIEAKCPLGTHVVGGGAGADNGNADINESRPMDSGDNGNAPDDGWLAYFNDTANASDMRVYAICE